MRHPIVVAITGASGMVYATRLLEVLINVGYDIHLSISPAGQLLLKQEMDLNVDLDDFLVSRMMLDTEKTILDARLDMTRALAGVSSGDSSVLPITAKEPGRVYYNHYADFTRPIASGSFLTSGMVICPCSSGTLSAVASGAASNLIQRAADVHLKERRKLILVPRETPVSGAQLDNMKRANDLGAVILPAAPGWYHGVRTIRDLVDFVVARIMDQLGAQHALMRRWGVEK